MKSVIAEPDGRLVSHEANHRFMNTLAALHGLLRSDFAGFADPAVRQAVLVFSSRIQAFASVHRTLSEADGEGLVDASAHLSRLCAELCAAHLAPRGLHCDFQADPGALPRKHAFIGRSSGRIRICLRRTVEGWVCLVADNGSGLRGGAGDGMKLVRGLAQAMGGDLAICSDPGGVVVTLRLPNAAFAGAAPVAATACHA
jgi:two-component sensor histidine kinase